jgi:hypothetical protein
MKDASRKAIERLDPTYSVKIFKFHFNRIAALYITPVSPE